MKRIIIPNAESYLSAIQYEISRAQDIRYFHPLEVVCCVLKGHNPYEAAQVFDHSPRSVNNWLHRLLDQGFSGLQDTPQPGRPLRL